MTGQAAIGVYGLGVMGRNLALNLAEKGVGVATFDPWPQARAAMASMATRWGPRALTESASVFVSELAEPAVILLMVKAGEPVDAAIAHLQPMLGAGAIIADGGNSHFRDSERRAAALARHGIGY
ncbi:MAG TPA: NAD(P)-binding domain-containing protein, partial [Stellaceae bacterium]|nr:NAD(P)-binding domain-containing protein [Stellaceae bacterium]